MWCYVLVAFSFSFSSSTFARQANFSLDIGEKYECPIIGWKLNGGTKPIEPNCNIRELIIFFDEFVRNKFVWINIFLCHLLLYSKSFLELLLLFLSMRGAIVINKNRRE